VADDALIQSLVKVANSLEEAIGILRDGGKGKSSGTESSLKEKSIGDRFSNKSIKDQIDLMNKLNDSLEKQKGLVADNTAIYDLQQQQYEETAQTLKMEYYAQLRILNEELALSTISAEQHAVAVQELDKNTATAARTNDEFHKSNLDLENSTKSVMKTFFGLDKNIKSFTGKLFEAKDALGSITKALGEVLNPAVIFNNVTAKIEESTAQMVMRTDAALASFNRLTAAGGSLNQVMFDAQYSARAMGVTIEGASAATGALYTQMSNFSKLGPQAQKELIQTTAGMESLGISSETTAGLLDVAMNSLRMSQDEANELSNDLAKLSIGLKLPAKELAEGFKNALPILAAYGKGAIKVFKGLAAAAKATSLSTQQLLGITEQFDTFEGAAKAAGSLNALLGGNLVNSMELLYATEDERIQILKRSFDQTGRNWDMLNKFEKKSIAAAIGITDMNEANKLFGSSSEQVDAYTNTLDAMGVSQEKVNEAMLAGQTLGQKFKAIVDGMAVMVMPIVNGLNAMLDAILGLDKEMDGHLIPGLAIVTTLMSGMMMKALKLGKILKGVFGLFKGIGGFLTKVFSPAFALIAVKAILITTILFGMYKALTEVGGPLDKIAARWEEFTTSEGGKEFMAGLKIIGNFLKEVALVLVEVGELAGNMLGGTLFTMFDGVLQILESIPMLFTDPLKGAINMITGLVKLVLGPALGPLIAVMEKMEKYGLISGGSASSLMSSLDPVQANDLIMRPGEKPIMLNKDDVVLAGTNLLGSEAARNTGVVNNATYNTSNVSNTGQMSAAPASGAGGDLVIEINGREIGRVAAEYIRKEYSLLNNSGY
jgi:hypothetical protein